MARQRQDNYTTPDLRPTGIRIRQELGSPGVALTPRAGLSRRALLMAMALTARSSRFGWRNPQPNTGAASVSYRCRAHHWQACFRSNAAAYGARGRAALPPRRLLHHPQEPGRRNWRPGLGNEHIGARALQRPQRPQLGPISN